MEDTRHNPERFEKIFKALCWMKVILYNVTWPGSQLLELLYEADVERREYNGHWGADIYINCFYGLVIAIML